MSSLGRVAGARAGRVARRVALGLVGVILLATGVGFLTLALWLALVAWKGMLFASLVVGLAFVGLGLIFMAVAAGGGKRPPPTPLDMSLAALIEAFVAGVIAGRRARREDKH